jgi:serine protease Do
MDLRVDLLLVRPPPSPREIYAAARGLEALAPEATFAAIRRALEAGQGVLLSRISEDLARQAEDLLAAHGAEARRVPHSGAASTIVESPAQVPARWLPLRWLLGSAIAVAILVVWVWLARPDTAPEKHAAAPQDPVAEVALAATSPVLSPRQLGALAGASAASLRCAESLGSGFFIGTDLLLTNAHVLCEDGSPLEVVLGDGRKLSGVAEREDRWLDVALVRVAGARQPALRLGDASGLQQGDQLYFYGSPRGLDFTLSQAMLSHATRPLQGLAYLQLDGNVNPGNSGGPLLDPRGEVVGIVTATVGEQSGLGLALPVNYLYEGEQPLVSEPAAVDRAAWQKIVSMADEDDQREVAEARESMQSAALAGVLLTSNLKVVAMVARHSTLEPYGEHFSFRLMRDGETLCSASGDAMGWRPAGSTSEATIGRHTRQWLRRNNLDSDVWVAAVPLDWTDCPTPRDSLGMEVVLVQPGAESAAVLTYAPGI